MPLLPFFAYNKKSAPKETFETDMIRGTTQIAYLKYATSQAPTSLMLLRSSHGRSLPVQMHFRTSGSEAIGHCVHLLSAHSNRRLSENTGTRPSSSLPFIMKLLELIITLETLLSTCFSDAHIIIFPADLLIFDKICHWVKIKESLIKA